VSGEGAVVAISEKSRSALYQGLVPIAGEEAVGEMLSYFPARDVDEPVTKELLRAEIATVKTEIADLRSEMHRSLNILFAALSATMVGVVGIATTVIIAVLH
jgi:hypothetical protein